MAQVAIFKNIRSSADLDCELFYSELKTSQRLTYIYYLATDNIYRVRKQHCVNKT